MEKGLKIFLSILLIVSIGASAVMYIGESGSKIIDIYIDGEIYETVNLSEVTESYEIKLPHNTVLIESDGVAVISADCPDKVCVKRGKMKGGAPIVCIPSTLYIKYREEVDAVVWLKQKELPIWRFCCALLL